MTHGPAVQWLETYEYTNMCVYHYLLRFPKSHSHSDHRIYWMVKIALTQFLYMTCCSLSPEPVES